MQALELAPAPWTKQITFSVVADAAGGIANPVLATFAKYPALPDGTPDFAQQPQYERFERVYVGNTIGATTDKWAGGVKFRSSIAGSPAVIVAERDFQTDIVVTSGNVSAASIAPNGETNPNPGAGGNVITGIIPAAGTAQTAGTGFTYTHVNGSGMYVFSFTKPFSARPVVLTEAETNANFAAATAITANGFTVTTQDRLGNLGDIPFSFTAQDAV